MVKKYFFFLVIFNVLPFSPSAPLRMSSDIDQTFDWLLAQIL